MRSWMTAAGLIAVLALPASAAADDQIIATTAKPTTVDAARGHAVWSAWDPAVEAYRLMEYTRAGQVRPTRVAPSPVPFDVDLGTDPFGGTMAVFSRCERPPLDTFALNGRRGCDLYYYRLAGGGAKLRNASSPGADEYWPTVANGRVAFTRTYKARGHRTRRYVYWRKFRGTGPSHRLRRGPDGGVPEQLDMRGRRVTYLWTFEFGGQVRVADTRGGGRALVRVPGSGAAARDLFAQGPTLGGGTVNWMLANDNPVVSEIRRVAVGGGDHERATTRIESDATLATRGFSQDGGTSWYVKAVGDAFEIHRMTGLAYEPAPPIVLE
jgi:hypothetical protein